MVASRIGLHERPLVSAAAAHVLRSVALAPRLVGVSHELGTTSHRPVICIWPTPSFGGGSDSASASVAGTHST